MCSTKDILYRIVLGNVAFGKLKKLWLHIKNITASKKLKVYETVVTPIMLYNSSTWAVPKAIFDKLDSAHRKHLRQILKIDWKMKVTNEKLYERSNLKPLSDRVHRARWTMLGKVLRKPENHATYCSLIFATHSLNTLKPRKGRHATNLLDMIKSDLKHRKLKFESIEDLETLRELAKDSTNWSSLYDDTD